MKNTLWRVLRFTRPYVRSMALAILLGVLTVMSGLGLMTLSAYVISIAALHPSLAVLSFAIIGVRFFGITRAIWRYLERYVSHTITFNILTQVRVWFYRALEPLAPARLLALTHGHGAELSSGELLSRLVADIDMLQEFYVRVIAPPIVATLVALLLWLLLGAYNVLLALTLLGFFLLAGVGVPLLVLRLSRSIGQQIVSMRAALNTVLIDSVQGNADLLAFGQEQAQAQKIQDLSEQLTRLHMRMGRIAALQDGLSSLLMNLALWTMLIVAIPLVHSGQLNGVYLAALALAAIGSFEAILPLPVAAQHLGGSLEAAHRLFEVVDAQPAVSDSEQPLAAPTQYTLAIQQLFFRYSATSPYVLQGVNFTIPQGHCVALVGPSGAGKSTIANLLLRFWEYEEGHILLDGRELREYRQEDIHRFISVVEQQTHLFNATIRENLLIAKQDATQEELEHAAQQAHIHDVIQSLPEGYDTRIGEQGLNLSGGERQRLALARAFLKDAPILIVDEATANLDALTEHHILEAIRTLIQGRTTLIITHRLVGLDMADEILVLQSGRVKERGVQHELLQAEGLYWRLWQLQNTVLQSVIEN